MIWLRDIGDFAAMNAVWDAWVVPGQTPARATVQAQAERPEDEGRNHGRRGDLRLERGLQAAHCWERATPWRSHSGEVRRHTNGGMPSDKEYDALAQRSATPVAPGGMSSRSAAPVGTAMHRSILAGLTADDTKADVKGQTKQILDKIDKFLKEAGTDKSKILSANIWLTDIGTWSQMNEVWDAWVAPGNTPARATVEAKLANPGAQGRDHGAGGQVGRIGMQAAKGRRSPALFACRFEGLDASGGRPGLRVGAELPT